MPLVFKWQGYRKFCANCILEIHDILNIPQVLNIPSVLKGSSYTSGFEF